MRHAFTLPIGAAIILWLWHPLCTAQPISSQHADIMIGEWPPYMSTDLPHHGPVAQIVTRAFAQVGVTSHVEFYNWNRSLSLVERGLKDVSIGWSKVASREPNLYFSAEPIIVERTAFFHKRSTPFQWQTLDDLKHLKIGITLGYKYEPAFDAAIAQHTLIKLYNEGFRALQQTPLLDNLGYPSY